MAQNLSIGADAFGKLVIQATGKPRALPDSDGRSNNGAKLPERLTPVNRLALEGFRRGRGIVLNMLA